MRFHERHAHQTILDMLQAELVAKGWGDASLPPTDPANLAVNFGTTPATYQKALPDVFGKAPVAPNTIAVTMGDGGSDDYYELGAFIKDGQGNYGLHVVEIPVFFDVFGEKSEIAVAICSDIKALVARKHRFLTIKDYTSTSTGVDSSEFIEFDTTKILGPEEPPAAGAGPDFRRNWRMVKAMAEINFNPQD